MSDATDAIRDGFQRDAEQFTITVDCDHERFYHAVLPFAIGFAQRTHGVTDVSYTSKTIEFTRHFDADRP